MFRRGAVDALSIFTHERLPTAGDDVGFETVGAQILHHFEHWLINEVSVRALPTRMCGLGEPRAYHASKVVRRHTGVRYCDQLLQIRHGNVCKCS